MSNNGILVFNNGVADLGLISALLEAEDCTVYITSLPLEAMHILTHKEIDVILASSHLEGMEGQEFKELVEKIKPGVSMFLIPSPPARGGMTCLGPDCEINMKEFVLFIQNHIRTEKRHEGEKSSFKKFFFSFTDRLLQIMAANDNYFFNNAHKVAELSRQVAEKMGLDEALVDSIHLAALLRDLGKIGIQQEILTGKQRLGAEDVHQVRQHPLHTIQLLRQIQFPWDVEPIIRHHHEHYNGNGYPDGLMGRKIPVGSRIIGLVEAYVAMTAERPYRKALTVEAAISEILAQAGRQFDPEVMENLFSLLQQKDASTQILVVDSGDSLSACIKLALSPDEYDVFHTVGAAATLPYLESQAPSLIVIDADTVEEELLAFYLAIRRRTHAPLLLISTDVKRHDLPPDGSVEFLAKPVEVETVVVRLRALAAGERRETVAAAPRVSKGVSGFLEDMGVTDIVQILNMGMKTARVDLNKDGVSCELYLKNGKIVSVKLGALAGEEAFFELIGWNRGEFSIVNGETTDQVNVTMETMTLLLEATKAFDEKRAMRPAVGM